MQYKAHQVKIVFLIGMLVLKFIIYASQFSLLIPKAIGLFFPQLSDNNFQKNKINPTGTQFKYIQYCELVFTMGDELSLHNVKKPIIGD